ncbi:hypothetical protein [Cellulomonas sp.]|uniref:hypothetical protein n=1 Tax=Cellulomonas sp. TaxID=40001 RepID=UPI002D2AA06F|nr:hypothetical protein [Cellulomonas sp.]HYQ76965.1 hypothetical protein [Cellulomonas sp.]
MTRLRHWALLGVVLPLWSVAVVSAAEVLGEHLGLADWLVLVGFGAAITLVPGQVPCVALALLTGAGVLALGRRLPPAGSRLRVVAVAVGTLVVAVVATAAGVLPQTVFSAPPVPRVLATAVATGAPLVVAAVVAWRRSDRITPLPPVPSPWEDDPAA